MDVADIIFVRWNREWWGTDCSRESRISANCIERRCPAWFCRGIRVNERYWDEKALLRDVKRTINDLHSKVKYKILCNGLGKLFLENEGEFNDGGYFYSFEYQKSKETLQTKKTE